MIKNISSFIKLKPVLAVAFLFSSSSLVFGTWVAAIPGIKDRLCRTPEVQRAAMMLLMLNARVPEIVTNQRQARWLQIFTPQIRGRTVLIIGVGDMGGGVAQAGRQLGLRVLGVRRSGTPHPDVEWMFKPDEIDAALPQADFLC
jgi:phosphoglycerate dehydrogenase-like enzyme